MHATERPPTRGSIARLLTQFAPRGVERRFARIELAGRKLEHHPADGITVLAFDHQPAVGQDRDDEYGTRVDDVLARGERAVGQPHDIATHMQQLAVENRLALDL